MERIIEKFLIKTLNKGDMMRNWCKILDGIAWTLDEQDNTIWGDDCAMDVDETNKLIDERLENLGIR